LDCSLFLKLCSIFFLSHIYYQVRAWASGGIVVKALLY
jgi:hypothetical protein